MFYEEDRVRLLPGSSKRAGLTEPAQLFNVDQWAPTIAFHKRLKAGRQGTVLGYHDEKVVVDLDNGMAFLFDPGELALVKDEDTGTFDDWWY